MSSNSTSEEKDLEPYVPEDQSLDQMAGETRSDLEVESMITRSTSVKEPSTDDYQLDDQGLLKIPLSSSCHPWSWSVSYRVFSTFVYGLTTCGVQFSTTYLSGDIEQLARRYHVGDEVATLCFSVFILGNIVGALLLAPITEIYGRKLGVFATNFMCGFIVCVTANVDSIAALTVFRFLAGIFAGAPLAGAPSAMVDVWSPPARVPAMMLYGTMIILGSSCSPVFGSLLSTNDPGYGVQWGAWLAGILQLVWSIFGFLSLKESNLLVIEQNVARDLRITSERWIVHAELDRLRMTPRDFMRNQLMRPVRLFFTTTMLCYNTLSSFVYGLFFLLVSTVGLEFIKVHKFGSTTSELVIFAIFTGFVIGAFMVICVGINMGRWSRKNNRPPAPEMILQGMMIGIPLLSAGCFMYGWSLYPFVHWIVPCIGLGLVGSGFCLVFAISMVYIVQCYSTPRASYAASAIAANMVLRSGMGGGFPLFAVQMYNTLNPHWASSLLGFLLAAAIPIPFVFYIYGAKIRAGDRMRKELETL